MESILVRNLASAAAIARRRSEECVPLPPPPLRAEAVPPSLPAQVLEARVIDGVFVQAGNGVAAYHRYARLAAETAEPPAPRGRVVEAWA